MNPQFSVCVFCGARPGKSSVWMPFALEVGKTLAQRGFGVIYGGGGVGLMGAVARGALQEQGQVIGVIPNLLMAQEQGNLAVTRLERVDSMAERKTRMIDLADAFLTLPGGLGTLDELFEVMTLRQIGFHQKPNAILNADGYFDGLISLLEGFTERGFVGASDVQSLIIESEISRVADRLEQALGQ